MRMLFTLALALSLWAATTTKDQGPSTQWNSMPKNTVTHDASASPAPPAEPRAPSLADSIAKPVATEPEPAVDLFPMPLRIAIALAVVAMIAYVIVTRVS